MPADRSMFPVIPKPDSFSTIPAAYRHVYTCTELAEGVTQQKEADHTSYLRWPGKAGLLRASAGAGGDI